MSMRVRADVIDVRRDSPRATDRFLVDSNVWFWVGYRNAERVSTRNQHEVFWRYLDVAFLNGAICYRCPLSYSELAHSIERSEWQLLLETGQLDAATLKEAHRHAVLRQRMLVELDVAWTLVLDATQDASLPLVVDDAMAGALAAYMQSYAIDGYDLLMLHAMHAANMTQLLTDDADFGQVPDIQVFTANPYLIQQATQQGRLITRPTE